MTKAGLFLLPSTIAMLVVGSQTGRLERRFGSKPPLLAGGVFSCASFALLAAAHSEQWEIYVAVLLLGSGIGLAFAAMANLIIENVGPGADRSCDRDEHGHAHRRRRVRRRRDRVRSGEHSHARAACRRAHGYTQAFTLCAIALVAGVLVGFAIPQRRPEATFEPHPVGDL